MSDQIDTQPIQQTLNNSQDILVALAQNPTHDMVAAGLALFLSFKSAGKNVEIACPSPMLVEFSRLVGLDKVKDEVGNKNLVISFDYIQDSIEKVNYHVEGQKFNLVVQPKKGSKPLSSQNVTFSYSGLQADMIFIVGANSYLELGDIYAKNQATFDSAYTVSLNHILDLHFAQTTITDPKASSHSEIAAWFLEKIGYQPTGDSASNLLAGIDQATNRFSSPDTPGTAFIAAGKLMQNGAVRQAAPQPRPKVPNIPLPEDSLPPAKPLVRPMSAEQSQDLEPTQDQLIADGQTAPTPPPQEWLEPKIFQGSTRV